MRTIRPGVFGVGAIDWERTMFDALIPLPDGTSYNSYLIRGSEKIALIDTVDPTKFEELKNHLAELKLPKIDYIISNHAEQDHSGSIPNVLEMYPDAKIVTNQKCADILKDMNQLHDYNFLIIQDREKLSLGDKTLEFILAPWVHWPETMLTYLHEEKILFSCDLFGSHLATSDLYVEDEREVYPAAKRYYAEIMMPFRKNIKGHMKKIRELDLELIAPSHGPIYGTPEMIMSAYETWISDTVKKEVIIVYVSMHNTTKTMAHYLLDRLMDRHAKVRIFNLTETELGKLAISIVDPAIIVVATPTVFSGPHPNVSAAVNIINALRPKTRFFGVVGSYSWGGKLVESIKASLNRIDAEYLEPVLAKGHNHREMEDQLDRMADDIAGKLEGMSKSK